MNKVTINEVCSRDVLSEGRDRGLAFAFLLPDGDNTYKTVFHMSPCKDFLNEPLFTENTGYSSAAHGLKCEKPIGIFNDEYAYIGIQWLKTKYDGYGNLTKNTFEEDVEYLKNNYSNIQSFLNIIEKKLEFNNVTIIEEANDNRYLIKIPKEWTTSTIMISLYTLLIRASVWYNNTDIIKYLENCKHIAQDSYLIKDMIPRLNVLLETKKVVPQPIFSVERLKKGQFSPHNLGILSWNMKYDDELVAQGVD